LPEATVQSERLDVSVWKIVSVAVLGSLLAQLDATVVNVSLSSLAADLHSTLSTIQWVTSGYLLALALMLPLNGWLVERIGAKSVYLWCFSTFTLCSALCGTAWSATSLIAFRVLQGMSGGLMAPMAQMMMARAAGKPNAARDGLRRYAYCPGAYSWPGARRGNSAVRFLALALPHQSACRIVGDHIGYSLLAE
jgi:MFS family permease